MKFFMLLSESWDHRLGVCLSLRAKVCHSWPTEICHRGELEKPLCFGNRVKVMHLCCLLWRHMRAMYWNMWLHMSRGSEGESRASRGPAWIVSNLLDQQAYHLCCPSLPHHLLILVQMLMRKMKTEFSLQLGFDPAKMNAWETFGYRCCLTQAF